MRRRRRGRREHGFQKARGESKKQDEVEMFETESKEQEVLQEYKEEEL